MSFLSEAGGRSVRGVRRGGTRTWRCGGFRGIKEIAWLIES